MSDLRAAAEQALDTLEHVQAHIGRYDPPVVTTIARAMQPTIDALRAALAAEQPQPEAVAWPKVNGTARMFDNARALMVIMEREPTDDEMRAFDDAIKGWGTSPPSAPEPSEAARLYIDGEWNSYRGELLSLALVGEDGSEWYEVIDFDGTPEPWVAANVMPKLRKAPISLEWMRGSLQRFLDRYPAGVHIVADWPEDIERFCRVLVTGPGQRLDTPPLTMEVVRIDPVSADPHNALADARALRDALRAAAAARTKC